MPNSPIHEAGAASRKTATAQIALGVLLLAGALGSGPEPARTAPVSVEPTALPAELFMFRKLDDGRIERLHDGAVVHEGDLVQAAYLAADDVHGIVVSIDGIGMVTMHHPDGHDETTRLIPRTMTPLDHSFELDDAPHFERFILVTTRDPDLDVGRVLQAATLLARMGRIAHDQPLALPPEYGQTSIVLQKFPR